jgi:tetratricopeptide (TPR) repeat protein
LSGIQCHLDLAATRGALGRGREAREIEASLLELAERDAPDSLLVSRVLIRIGARDQVAGDLGVAEAAFVRAAEIAERVGPWSSTWGQSQTALAGILGARGDLATAEDMLRKAAEHQMRHSPDSLDAGRALLNLGGAAFARGDMVAALQWSAAAVRILEPLPIGLNIRAAVLNILGRIAFLTVIRKRPAVSGARGRGREATSPRSVMIAIVEVNLSEALSARGD